jgi:hypothetical protein
MDGRSVIIGAITFRTKQQQIAVGADAAHPEVGVRPRRLPGDTQERKLQQSS